MVGELAEAEELYTRNLNYVHAIGNRRSEYVTLGGIGMVVRDVGKLEEARGYLEQGLAIARELDYRYGEET